jgi:DNA ligase-1
MKAPMLAVEAPKDLKFPVLASAKLDGIRGIVEDGVLYSRSGKPIPNLFVQAFFKEHAEELEGLDGELIVGPPNAKDVYLKTNSAVMTIKGEPDFNFYVFDWVNTPTLPYIERMRMIEEKSYTARIVVLQQLEITNDTELTSYEEKCLQLGYEGLIVRSPTAPYKHGRSTAREGYLLKVRRFSDSEAEIIGFQEEMENTNLAKEDVFGHTERSSAKSGMVGKDTLGAVRVRDLKTGVEFSVGSGFTADQRKDFWIARKLLFGKIIKYRYFEVGVKDAPRFPTFHGFRDKIDMS